MRCKILFLLVVYSVLGFGQPLNRSIVRTTQYLSTDSIRPLSADGISVSDAKVKTLAPVSNWKNNVSLQIDDIRAQYGTMTTPQEPIAADSGVRCDIVTVTNSNTAIIDFSDKPYANNQYTAELTIIDQDGFECGYESIEKTESGFTVTLEETGNYTIKYVTNKI